MIEEQCTQSDLGISYKKFIKKCLGPHTNQVIAEELKKTIGHPFDMLILLAGVDAGNSPHLYVISDTAITSYITLGYAAVGCGTTIATTSLADDGKGYYRRSIAETSYRVYEAKRAAQQTGLVGTTTDMVIIRESDDPQILDAQRLNVLSSKYDARHFRYALTNDEIAEIDNSLRRST